MLPFVPLSFESYRPLQPRLRWAMACLVSFADRAGRCFPSVRKLAAFAGMSKSAAARHLADLVEAGVITRKRRPGGVYDYQIDPRFLPRAPVSHSRAEGVPWQVGQETDTRKQTGKAHSRPRFAKPGLIDGLSDQSDRWQARVRSWINSGGKFWLGDWGPRPDEPGCFAPAQLLTR